MKQCVLLLTICIALFASIGNAFQARGARTARISSFSMMSTAATPSPNPLEMMMKSFQDMMSPKPKIVKPAKVVVDTTQYDAEIDEVKSLLVNAAITKKEDGDKVVDALLSLEQLMRAKNKLDEGATSRNTLENLDGAWRLIFTTGTIDTQKKLGRKINYFPIKAAQCFDTSTMKLTNGIFLGNVELIKFFGEFEWKEMARKVEFDFDAISVLGLKFDLPKGGAAKIGSSTGLGSDNNEKLIDKGKKPFFNWISADSNIATARGGGGGLALWQRDVEMQIKNQAAADALVAKPQVEVEVVKSLVQPVRTKKAEPEFLYEDNKY